MAISQETEDEIRRLRSGGASYRAIASKLLVSRGTIADVLYHRKRRERNRRERKRAEKSGGIAFRTVARYMCPTCRRLLVVEPCPACHALEYAKRIGEGRAVESVAAAVAEQRRWDRRNRQALSAVVSEGGMVGVEEATI